MVGEITTWVTEKVVVQPSSQSCPIERSDSEAISGKVRHVHASAEGMLLETGGTLLSMRTEMPGWLGACLCTGDLW